LTFTRKTVILKPSGKNGLHIVVLSTNTPFDRETSPLQGKTDSSISRKKITGEIPIKLFEEIKERKMNIYVGNLPFEVTEDQLRQAFEVYGEVDSVNIIKDKYSGQSKGFGFIEMSDDAKAQAAIDGLNQTEMQGRTINVSKARPRTERRGGDRGRGGGGRGGGGGRRW
jgi:RNA recognition motif-containing protein